MLITKQKTNFFERWKLCCSEIFSTIWAKNIALSEGGTRRKTVNQNDVPPACSQMQINGHSCIWAVLKLHYVTFLAWNNSLTIMLMLQSLVIGWMVSVSATPPPHYLFLHYVTFERVGSQRYRCTSLLPFTSFQHLTLLRHSEFCL